MNTEERPCDDTEAGIYEPRRQASETKSADSLISNFWLPDWGRNKLLSFEEASLWPFVLASLAS